MARGGYRPMGVRNGVNRRNFLKTGGVIGAGFVLAGPILGTRSLWAQESKGTKKPARPKTNIEDALKIPKTINSLPGPFPGKTVEIYDSRAMVNTKPVPEFVRAMFEKGMEQLTGLKPEEAFALFFNKEDVIGIKVNPVGPGIISTHLELVDAIIDWLEKNGVKRGNIIIWDRFDYMLKDAGIIAERFPGIGIEGLQTMDESAAGGESNDDSRWLDKAGNHLSAGNFDKDVYYWVDVNGPKDKPYLNQHVFNGKYSYYGKLLTKKLTKIINVPVLKNTDNGISVATKNLGYGAICNTGRLHEPLFFDVCTEVLAFPVIRDKLALNIADALVAQYDGGPMPVAEFCYPYNALLFATDPFALDMVCQKLMVEKRKSMDIKVNEHPVFTEYLRYAERLALGVVDPAKTKHIKVELG